jgi:alkylhydroperoxidase/carboxymuconolactone decarboxylase family protein YurZ
MHLPAEQKSRRVYALGKRGDIKAALKLGATMEEIMELLKLRVVQ